MRLSSNCSKHDEVHLSRLMGKPTMWFPNRSDTNRPVQAQKRARSLKFRIEVEEALYYPSSENKGADQLRGYREADLRLCFRICRLLVFPWGGSFSLSESNRREVDANVSQSHIRASRASDNEQNSLKSLKRSIKNLLTYHFHKNHLTRYVLETVLTGLSDVS